MSDSMNDRDEMALSVEECLLAAVFDARSCSSGELPREMTDECPQLGPLLKGARSGSFSEAELRHLAKKCRYCQRTLGRAFAEACPPMALNGQAPGGALQSALEGHAAALEVHAANCAYPEPVPCDIVPLKPVGRPAAPDPSPDGVSSRRRLGPSAADVGQAVRTWRAADPTLRLGTRLALAGVAVAVVGIQSRGLDLPWGSALLGLGVATSIVGGYLGVPRDLLSVRGARPRHRNVALLHRVTLASALLALAFLAGMTGWRFRPRGPDQLAIDLARLGMGGGALLAGVACLIGFTGVAIRRRPNTKTDNRSGCYGRRDANHPRAVLTRGAIRACGAACIIYAGTHVVVAAAIAPNIQMQVTLLVAAGLLALAATESFHPALAYERCVDRWINWWTIVVAPSKPPGSDARSAVDNTPPIADDPGADTEPGRIA